jgi:hypothetical protein
MRYMRFAVILTAATALAACHESETGIQSRPPLAGVRFINALPDTGTVDIRAIDQVEWSPVVNSLPYRTATEYQPIQADRARKFRVFPTDTTFATSKFLIDGTLTFQPGHNYTVLVTGLARAGTQKFVLLTDDVTVPAGNIAVRAVNAASGTVGLYLTNTSTDPLPGSASATAADASASTYSNRAVGAVFARVLSGSSTTPVASVAGPTRPASPQGSVLPAAGVDAAGSAFSVMYFPASVAGSKAPQTAAFLAPAAIWFVDKLPSP